jgi:preprotein translocase subunit YajC
VDDDKLLLIIIIVIVLMFMWIMSRPRTVVVQKTGDGYVITEK